MKSRVKFLNLFKIHLPITATVSIGHRVTGVLLAVLMLWAMYTLYFITVCNEYSWQWLSGHLLWQFPALIFLISFLFHLVAGLRHMIEDHMPDATLSHAVSTAKWTVYVWIVLVLLAMVGFVS